MKLTFESNDKKITYEMGEWTNMEDLLDAVGELEKKAEKIIKLETLQKEISDLEAAIATAQASMKSCSSNATPWERWSVDSHNREQQRIIDEKTAELNDEFAKTQGYDNVDALYAGVRADYEANLLAQAETSQATQLLEKIVADSAFNMNEEEIQLYVDYAMEQQKSMAESYGFDMETYASIYGMTVEQLEESCREYAMYQIQVPLVRFEIAEAEGLKVTDKIYKELATEMMAGYGFESLEEFEAAYDKAIIEKMVLEEMAINFVMEHSVAEERIVPEETE